MRKLYFIIPAILACIFAYFFFTEKKAIQADLEAERTRLVQEAEERKQRELEKQDHARKEAVVQAELRAKEREQKRLEEDAQKEALQIAVSDREKALQERERAYKQSLKYQEDLSAAKDQLRRARERVGLQQVQVDHIKDFVKEITAKKEIYQNSLNKLEVAERAAAAAAAARAAAATPSRRS